MLIRYQAMLIALPVLQGGQKHFLLDIVKGK